MAHGLDDVETEHAAAPPGGAADRVLAMIDDVVVIVSSVALVAASFVLTYSVIVRYFLQFSTDWQDEMSVFLIVGAVFMSSAAVQAASISSSRLRHPASLERSHPIELCLDGARCTADF